LDRLAVNNFQNEASKVQLDLTCDSEEGMRRSTQMKKWDRKKKKMVAVQVRFEKRKCR
jgi:predicted GIY-YIG superfamily endonuclease